MHFCENCGNMYYVRLLAEDSDELIYYCRKCNNKKELKNDDDICVSKLHVKTVTQTYKNIINEYTKLDPTLPRINTINCPNKNCDSNRKSGDRDKKKKEIIYLRYDDTNIKYVYLCCVCDKTWLNSKN